LEGYRIDIKNLAVPSVPVFLFVVSAVIFINELNNHKFNLIIIILPLLFIISIFFTLYNYYPLIRRKGLRGYLFTFFICICSGLLLITTVNRRVSEFLHPGNIPEILNNPLIIITGEKPVRAGREIVFKTQDSSGNHMRGVLIIKGETDVTPGDIVVIHKSIKRINFRNRDNYSASLIRQGIFYKSYAGPDDITVIEKNICFRDRVRGKFFRTIDKIFPEESGSIIKALYSGNRSFISTGIILGFRDAGIIHILAASGLHVGIIAAIPMFFLFTGLNRKYLLTISLFLVGGYLFLTDMPVSLIRASVMFAVVYLQVVLYREVKALNSLFLAGTAVLLIYPWQVYSPGFQLSFGATAGIILFYKGYSQVFRNFPRYIGSSFSATLAAQVVTVPLLFFHMNQFNLASLPANLAAVPLVSGMMVISAFALIFYPFSSYLAEAAGKAAHLVYELLAVLTDFFSGMSLNYHIESGTVVFITSIIIAVVPFISFNGRKAYGISAIILAMFIPFAAFTRVCSDDLQYITITSGKSIAEINVEGDNPKICFRIADYKDGKKIFERLKFYNIEPAVLELNNYSFPDIFFSKMIMNNFRINKVVINEAISVKWGMEEIYRICDLDNIELSIEK